MSAYLLISAWLLSILGTGFLAARLALDRDADHAAEFWLPVSCGLGMFANAFCSLLFLAAGALIPAWSYWLPAALLLAANIAFAGKAVPLARFRGFSFSQPCEFPEWRPLYLLAIGVCVGTVALFGYLAATYPFESYDGRAIWMFKSHILFRERTVFGESFMDPYRLHYHPNYPLLVPLTTFRLYDFLGYFRAEDARFLYAMVYAMSAMFAFGAMASGAGRLVAAAATAVMIALPFRDEWAMWDATAITSAEADFIFAYLATMSGVCWWRWWGDRRRQHIVLGSIFCAAALMAKAEGIVFLAALGAANGLRFFVRPEAPRARLFGVLAAALVAIAAMDAPSRFVVSKLPNFYDEKYSTMLEWEKVKMMPLRIPVVLKQFRWEAMGFDKWSVFGVAFMTAMMLRFRNLLGRGGYAFDAVVLAWSAYEVYTHVSWVEGRWWVFGSTYFAALMAGAHRYLEDREFFVDCLVGAWLLAYLVTYLMSPLALSFHLNTSLRRLYSQLYPIISIQAVVWWWLAAREVFAAPAPEAVDAPGPAAA